MYDTREIKDEIFRNLREIKEDIKLLYGVQDIYTKNLILNCVWSKTANLEFLVNLTNQKELPIFNKTELAKYNGRDGNRAYVAVNGVVYDVTNNAAWAAATHFGLKAGEDLTKQFAGCHQGQSAILQKLKVVGRYES